MRRFKFYRQLNEADCGPTCLRMIAAYYGRDHSINKLSNTASLGMGGVSLKGLSKAAEEIGLRTRGVEISLEQLRKDVQLPCILHWNENHFVVLVSRSRFGKRPFLVADPAVGTIRYNAEDLKKSWLPAGADKGYALLLEPSKDFYEQSGDDVQKVGWGMLFRYIMFNKAIVFKVLIALIVSSLIQFAFPFLTQSVVDNGINTGDINFIMLVLIGQFMLVFSKAIVDFIRSRLLLLVSVFINLSILSDFWIKLTHLPMSYYDRHPAGEIIQRIGDQRTIQGFLTGVALNTLFSAFTFVMFGAALVIYDLRIFLIFITGSVLYFFWIRLFLRIRRKLNTQIFKTSTRENNATLQLAQGMHEIKLNNAEQYKRWEWENIQVSKFKLSLKSLSYNQLQQGGALLINQSKDILITFFVASLVIQGNLTFGAMLAIQYILGQLSGPVEQFVVFIQSSQDASISMDRLNEVHSLPDENADSPAPMVSLPDDKSITLKNFSFAYPGADKPVLKDINLKVEAGKVTAIVGVSGSGKTTLLKILLKYYSSYEGEIKVGESNLKYIDHSFWRSQCGVVMQDGFLFSASIAENIAVGVEQIDMNRVAYCCKVANILPFIESLSKGYNTKLGTEGISLSQGQRQRILIARSLYKNPQYLFFDEATNALDAENEKVISENLSNIIEGRTVVIVAHRLSTVRNADNIIVMDNGRICERGDHAHLSLLKGKYYELVRNQLELGK